MEGSITQQAMVFTKGEQVLKKALLCLTII
jgi:hypothetical protein